MKNALIALAVVSLVGCGKRVDSPQATDTNFNGIQIGIERDDSDPPDGLSGLIVLTDNLTGCQYLSVRRKAITPRLKPDGKQVCIATNTEVRF